MDVKDPLGLTGWNPWLHAFGWNPWWSALPASATDAASVRTRIVAQTQVMPQGGATKSVELPPLDTPRMLANWSLDVRISLYVAEFISRIDFDINDADESVGVRFRGVDGTYDVVKLKRPSAAEIDTGADGLASTRAQHPPADSWVDAVVAQNENIDDFMLSAVGLTLRRGEPSTGAQFELGRAFVVLANLVCQRLKQAFAVPRPGELDSSLVPVLPVPQHGSFPGGHATMAWTLVMLIKALRPAVNLQALEGLAEEIAVNRVRAGLHYQLDSVGGRKLGAAIGALLLALLAQDDGRDPRAPRDLPLLGELWREAQ